MYDHEVVYRYHEPTQCLVLSLLKVPCAIYSLGEPANYRYGMEFSESSFGNYVGTLYS